MGILESHNTRLRAVEPYDVDFMLAVENDDDAWIYSDTVAPLSKEILTQYALSYQADPERERQLRLILETIRNPHPVGIVDLYDIDLRHRRAFVGIYILSGSRKKGYGTEGLEIISRLAHISLNLEILGAKIADYNYGSIRFFEKCGYQTQGFVPQWMLIGNERHSLHIYTRSL